MKIENAFLDEIIRKIEDKLIAGNREFQTMQTLDYLEYFKELARPDIEDRKQFQSVVGFDNSGYPRFWDMTDGNFFMHSVTGDEVETLGATAIFASLASRFTKEELCYWFVAYQSENLFSEARAYCKEYVRYAFNDNKDEYTDSLLRLKKELERRVQLSTDELTKEQFMLVILEAPCLVVSDSPLLKQLFDLLFERGKELKCACLLLSNRSGIEWTYEKYKYTFSCEWTGLKEFVCSSKEQEEWVKNNSKFVSLEEGNHRFGVFLSNGKQEVLLNPYYSLGLGLK